MGVIHIRDEAKELERVLNQKCYWCVLVNNVHLCVFIKRKQMNIKLPIPQIFANPAWHDEWKWKKHDDEEIARCRAMWRELAEAIEKKIQRIDTAESTVEEEFKANILFEDGKYGLKYKEKWPL